MKAAIFVLLAIAGLVTAVSQSDLNIVTNIRDVLRFQKTLNQTAYPNAMYVATLAKGTRLYRIEYGDSYEKYNDYFWYCMSPKMCMTVGLPEHTVMGTYELQQDVNMVVYGGLSTWQHRGVEPAFLSIPTREAQQELDYIAPDEFCNKNGGHGMNGYLRTYFEFELVLCKPSQILKQIVNVTYSSTSGNQLAKVYDLLFAESVDRIEDRIDVDWTSINLLMPELKPAQVLNDSVMLPDVQEPSEDEASLFQLNVQRTINITLSYPIVSKKEQRAVQSLANAVDDMIDQYASALSFVGQEYVTDDQLQFGLKAMMNPFGMQQQCQTTSCTQLCMFQFDVTKSVDQVQVGRRDAFKSVSQSILNVAEMICQPLCKFHCHDGPFLSSQYQYAVHQLKEQLNWTDLQQCKACTNNQFCFKGEYDRTLDVPYRCIDKVDGIMNRQHVAPFKLRLQT